MDDLTTERKLVKCPTAKGKNIYVIVIISQDGLMHCQKRRGYHPKKRCCSWLKAIRLRDTELLDKVVAVCDNAQAHCKLESVFEEKPFSEAKLIWLAPYIFPLKPFDECRSVLKAGIKREIAAKMSNMLSGRVGRKCLFLSSGTASKWRTVLF